VEPSVPFFLYKLRVKYTRTRACTYVPIPVARGWRGGGGGESFCLAAVASCRRAIETVDCGTRLRARPQDATAVLLSSPLSLSLSLSLLLLKCFCFAQNGPAFRLPIPRARFLAGSFRIFRISFSISRRVADNARVNGSLIIRSGCLLNYPAVRYSRPDGPAATSKSEKPLCGICIPDART
jgi:hypothetical protein